MPIKFTRYGEPIPPGLDITGRVKIPLPDDAIAYMEEIARSARERPLDFKEWDFRVTGYGQWLMGLIETVQGRHLLYNVVPKLSPEAREIYFKILKLAKEVVVIKGWIVDIISRYLGGD